MFAYEIGNAGKDHNTILQLEYDRLFRSYLRVNQASRQVIACVTINACPFSTEKKHWEIPTIALFSTLKFDFFWKSLKMEKKEKKNASFMLFFL